MKKIINHLITFFIIQGILLITFASLIVLYPDILNYLIAGFLFIFGLNSIYFAIKIKMCTNKFKGFLAKLKA